LKTLISKVTRPKNGLEVWLDPEFKHQGRGRERQKERRGERRRGRRGGERRRGKRKRRGRGRKKTITKNIILLQRKDKIRFVEKKSDSHLSIIHCCFS
jgi:hypothetical protein